MNSRKILKDGIFALFGKLFNILLVFIINGILARNLSEESMGEYFLYLNIATFFSILFRFGNDISSVRLIAEGIALKQSNKVRDVQRYTRIYLLSSFLLFFLLSFLLWGVAYLFSLNYRGGLYTIVIGWAAVVAGQFCVSETLRGLSQIRLASIVAPSGNLLISLGLLLLFKLWVGAGVYQVLSVITVCWFSVMVLGATLVHYNTQKVLLVGCDYCDKFSCKKIFNVSWPLGVRTLLVFFLSYSDIWIISYLGDKSELAFYASSARFIMLLTLVLQIVNSVLAPTVAKLNARNDTENLAIILRGASGLAAIPCLILLILFIVFGKEILSLVFGRVAYQQGYVYLVILSCGKVVSALTGSCGTLLMMTGHERLLLKLVGISSLLAVSLGYIAGSLWGSVGVAVAYSFVGSLQQVFLLFSAYQKTGLWTCASYKSTRLLVNNFLSIK